MKNRIFIGSAFLVMIIVGSGIMAQNLTRFSISISYKIVTK